MPVASDSGPIVSAYDLGTYLGNTNIDQDRANMVIADAQALCESIISPLPAGAELVVRRIAARGYANVTSAVSTGMGTANVHYASPGAVAGIGGVYLSRADKADLRRLSGGGGAFTVDVTPDGAMANLPPWDQPGYVWPLP